MSNDKIFLDEVHPLNKVIGIILFCATILLTQYTWLLLVFSVLFLIVSQEYPMIRRVSYGSILLGMLTIFYPQFLWISKSLIIVLYLMLLSKIMKLEQVKHLFELCFYQFKSTAITKLLISTVYTVRLFKQKYRQMDDIRKSYGLGKTKEFRKLLLTESYKKAKTDRKEYVMIHQLRFYNLYTRRTNVEDSKWESWDTSYLMLHLVVLIITVILGR